MIKIGVGEICEYRGRCCQSLPCQSCSCKVLGITISCLSDTHCSYGGQFCNTSS